MKNDVQSLQNLVKYIDETVESLMVKISTQKQEILFLQKENDHLKKYYASTLEDITQYITQLEQIKKQYVNNYNKSK